MDDRDAVPVLTARSHQKDHCDYDYIIAEISKIAQKTPEEQIQDLRNDPFLGFAGLKAPQGRTILISREVEQRFVQIAVRGLKGLGAEARRHKLADVLARLKDEFTLRVFDGFEISDENAHDIVITAFNKLEESYKELTHYIPCSTVVQRSCERFTIGPVTFVLREPFLKEHENAIRQSVRS